MADRPGPPGDPSGPVGRRAPPGWLQGAPWRPADSCGGCTTPPCPASPSALGVDLPSRQLPGLAGGRCGASGPGPTRSRPPAPSPCWCTCCTWRSSSACCWPGRCGSAGLGLVQPGLDRRPSPSPPRSSPLNLAAGVAWQRVRDPAAHAGSSGCHAPGGLVRARGWGPPPLPAEPRAGHGALPLPQRRPDPQGCRPRPTWAIPRVLPEGGSGEMRRSAQALLILAGDANLRVAAPSTWLVGLVLSCSILIYRAVMAALLEAFRALPSSSAAGCWRRRPSPTRCLAGLLARPQALGLGLSLWNQALLVVLLSLVWPVRALVPGGGWTLGAATLLYIWMPGPGAADPAHRQRPGALGRAAVPLLRPGPIRPGAPGGAPGPVRGRAPGAPGTGPGRGGRGDQRRSASPRCWKRARPKASWRRRTGN